MKNRYRPFGYGMERGEGVVIPGEADVIRRIFQEYISGASLKTIAQALTAERIPYLPGKWTWNKNRVDRILCDKRYLGTEDYAPIVDTDVFHLAQETRRERNTQTAYNREKVISPAVVPILCGKCGHPAERRHDRRTAFQQKYVCQDPSCKAEYHITDDKMLMLISTLLGQAELTRPKEQLRDAALEIRRMENEIARMLERPDTDADVLKEMILECAALKYKTASKGQCIYDKLRADMGKAVSPSSYTRKTVMETVKQIVLKDDDTIEITLPNGQMLERKEQTNGADQGRTD